MLLRVIRNGLSFLSGALLLACCSGCSIIVQYRYSVFGFDGLQTESAQQARVWSFALLASVAVVSSVLGAAGYGLSRRWYRRWREEEGRGRPESA